MWRFGPISTRMNVYGPFTTTLCSMDRTVNRIQIQRRQCIWWRVQRDARKDMRSSWNMFRSGALSTVLWVLSFSQTFNPRPFFLIWYFAGLWIHSHEGAQSHAFIFWASVRRQGRRGYWFDVACETSTDSFVHEAEEWWRCVAISRSLSRCSANLLRHSKSFRAKCILSVRKWLRCRCSYGHINYLYIVLEEQ